MHGGTRLAILILPFELWLTVSECAMDRIAFYTPPKTNVGRAHVVGEGPNQKHITKSLIMMQHHYVSYSVKFSPHQ